MLMTAFGSVPVYLGTAVDPDQPPPYVVFEQPTASGTDRVGALEQFVITSVIYFCKREDSEVAHAYDRMARLIDRACVPDRAEAAGGVLTVDGRMFHLEDLEEYPAVRPGFFGLRADISQTIRLG